MKNILKLKQDLELQVDRRFDGSEGYHTWVNPLGPYQFEHDKYDGWNEWNSHKVQQFNPYNMISTVAIMEKLENCFLGDVPYIEF